ncbi:LysR family transcriptional regulator [Kitasatospora sp. NPDC096147]|uniref:LysR family transcriptional regulator n=1 Tax=Kitasatospora sp. NPDC096147 TaxID=3364093 RepID=UPI003813F691
MGELDLNLLVALDALLEEESVTGAAERLHLSVPAMSRTLGRLRRALGDPVLVRSGRAMVPTPRALALRARVHGVLVQAQALFAPDGPPDPAALTGSHALLAHDEIVHSLGAGLLAAVGRLAPGLTLRFLAEPSNDSDLLRRGEVALEIGVLGDAPAEVTVEPLLTDRLVGVVRAGHPLASGGRVTARRLAGARHLAVSRRGRLTGPLDEALAGAGLARTVAATVPTFAAALLLLREADLVGMVPERLCRRTVEGLGLRTFPVPLDLPELPIAMAWHPRYELDGAHGWLRGQVREVAAEYAEQ